VDERNQEFSCAGERVGIVFERVEDVHGMDTYVSYVGTDMPRVAESCLVNASSVLLSHFTNVILRMVENPWISAFVARYVFTDGSALTFVFDQYRVVVHATASKPVDVPKLGDWVNIAFAVYGDVNSLSIDAKAENGTATLTVSSKQIDVRLLRVQTIAETINTLINHLGDLDIVGEGYRELVDSLAKPISEVGKARSFFSDVELSMGIDVGAFLSTQYTETAIRDTAKTATNILPSTITDLAPVLHLIALGLSTAKCSNEKPRKMNTVLELVIGRAGPWDIRASVAIQPPGAKTYTTYYIAKYDMATKTAEATLMNMFTTQATLRTPILDTPGKTLRLGLITITRISPRPTGKCTYTVPTTFPLSEAVE